METTNKKSKTKTPPDESQRQMEESILRGRMGDIGQKLLVLSGKGGVGKSTVAVNLAVALARAGWAVGLLDVDIHGPSIPKLMGLEGRRAGSDGRAILPIELTDNLKVMSIGLMLQSTAEAVIWRGPLKYKVIRQFLQDVDWGPLDALVIDSPPGTGDEPLSVAQLVGTPAWGIIVTTPQEVAIADVRRCISFCQKLMLPVAGIIENMSGFVCPHCGKTTDLFKSGGGEDLAGETNVPFLGRIPLDPQIVSCGDLGKPFIKAQPKNQTTEAFDRVVKSILDGCIQKG